MKTAFKFLLAGMVAVPALVGNSSPAEACGGFFCSQTQPVNQAAERIIFADNGDGTVTAVIQIMYEGPSEDFSWLLPISSVPMGDEIAVASDIAFQRLQAATNPQYNLTTTIEGTCKTAPTASPGGGGTGGSAAVGGSGGSGISIGGGGVMVEGSGVVGNFEWTVISFDESLEDPADAAVTWLSANEYDVPAGAAALIKPYLEDGLYLLALKLKKGSDTGSIRPIVLTYDASRPMIPIKLTAVAANEDMGVMTWVLGESRAVPQNYLSLELNEARINWFNAASNYNDVVTAAANEGDGRGFVTEFAGPSSTLANVVWTQFDESQWEGFQNGVFSGFQEMFDTAYGTWGQLTGFWDAVEEAVTLPDGVAFEDFKLCPSCYSAELQFMPSALVAALDKHVIEPMRRVQTLLDAHPHVTRLYTTMSAEEMIVDPLFTFNPDLPDLSNIHTAPRIIECSPEFFQWEAPWRIELPQGGVVRGVGSQTTWPDALSEQPSNLAIVRQGETGDGQVLEDNREVIGTMLEQYNAGVPEPIPSAGTGGGSTGGAGGSAASGGTGGSTGGATGGTTAAGGTTGGTTADGGTSSGDASDRDSGGCSVSGAGFASGANWSLLGLLLLAFRRARRRGGR